MWSQARVLFGAEMRSELRTGEVASVIVPFGAVALLLIPLAVGIDTPLLQRIGPGIFFAVVLLFGVSISQRQSAADSGPQGDLLRMLGVDPVSRLAARIAATGALLTLFQLVAGAVTIALYDPGLRGWPWLAAVIPLVSVGLAILGTLAAAVASSHTTRVGLAPLLVVPLAIPILLGGSQAVEGLQQGTGILTWILLLVVTDLILLLGGVLAAGTLAESTQ